MAFEATRVSAGTAIDFTPSGAAVAAGEVVSQGALIGVAPNDIADGVLGAIEVEGIFDFTKVAAEVISAGDVINWIGGVAAGVAAGDLLGFAVQDSATAETTVRVKLSM